MSRLHFNSIEFRPDMRIRVVGQPARIVGGSRRDRALNLASHSRTVADYIALRTSIVGQANVGGYLAKLAREGVVKVRY